MRLCRLISLCFVVTTCTAADYYDAAVVELEVPNFNITDDDERLNATVKHYVDQINNFPGNLDIIVFPESTLTKTIPDRTFVPEPLSEVLCNSNNSKYKNYLKVLSCAAIAKNTVVVVNIGERVDCKEPPPDERCTRNEKKLEEVYHNTDVVFNEKGQVVARYRKWNLFGEPFLSTTRRPEIVTFTTKSKDTFGIFTCFDILFDVPTLNFSRHLNVRNVVFPTHWFSELPYLTALQVQQMWAQENDVVLLSAGANMPSTGSGGSGIYFGHQGAINTTIVPSPGGHRLLYQKVPKHVGPNQTNLEDINEDIDSVAGQLDDFKLLVDPTVYVQNSKLLNINKTLIEEEVCHGTTVTTCCTFKINITVNNMEMTSGKAFYTYYLAAFNGLRSFSGMRDGGIESCGVMACLRDTANSCGQRFKSYSNVTWPITFNSIEIVGNFTNSERKIQYPNSLLASLRPISPKLTVWKKEIKGGFVQRTHASVAPQSRLLTFGIYGRDFGRDGPPGSYSSANVNCLGTILLALVCLVVFRWF